MAIYIELLEAVVAVGIVTAGRKAWMWQSKYARSLSLSTAVAARALRICPDRRCDATTPIQAVFRGLEFFLDSTDLKQVKFIGNIL